MAATEGIGLLLQALVAPLPGLRFCGRGWLGLLAVEGIPLALDPGGEGLSLG